MNFQILEYVAHGESLTVGEYSILGFRPQGCHDDQILKIGNGVTIGRHCSIAIATNIGDDVSIEDNAVIYNNNQIGMASRIGPSAVIRFGNTIGNHVRIHAHSFLERVIIKDHVFIGPHVVFTDDPHPPCPKFKECVPETIIESYVSVGANTVFAPGLTIGHHSQIYAGSVVVRDVEPYSVVCGNPAQKIKDSRELECKAGSFSLPFEWWDNTSV